MNVKNSDIVIKKGVLPQSSGRQIASLSITINK
jgi:hypothetical protein